MKLFLAAAAATTTVGVTEATAADAVGAAVGGIRGSSKQQQEQQELELKRQLPRHLQYDTSGEEWTISGCPTTTVASKDPCTIPAGPWLYQYCGYGPKYCTCRRDQPIFLCQPYEPSTGFVPTPPGPNPKPPGPNPKPPGPKPKPPVPVTPVPATPTDGPIPVPPVPIPTPAVPTAAPILVTTPPVPEPTPEEPTPSGGGGGGLPPFAPPSSVCPEGEPPAVINPVGLCKTNAVGSTCNDPSKPNIACCASVRTGAFFNACCVENFAGITFGGSYANQSPACNQPNEFDIMMGDDLGEADCVAQADGQGCNVFNVPGNEPSTTPPPPLVYPPGVAGPCVEVASGTSCASNEHGGFCTDQNGAGRQFDVCCPTCATGTYNSFDSCVVILPDPAACGINIVDGPTIPGGGGGGLPPTPSPIQAGTLPGDVPGGNNGGEGAAPLSSTGKTCPLPRPDNGVNCCDFLSQPAGGVADEASCLYPPGLQCRCPGQLNTEGVSYCQTIGWNCDAIGSIDSSNKSGPIYDHLVSGSQWDGEALSTDTCPSQLPTDNGNAQLLKCALTAGQTCCYNDNSIVCQCTGNFFWNAGKTFECRPASASDCVE